MSVEGKQEDWSYEIVVGKRHRVRSVSQRNQLLAMARKGLKKRVP